MNFNYIHMIYINWHEQSDIIRVNLLQLMLRIWFPISRRITNTTDFDISSTFSSSEVFCQHLTSDVARQMADNDNGFLKILFN